MSTENTEHRSAETGCPGRDALAALALGKLPLEAIEVLSRHVEQCPVCQEHCQSLDHLEDSFVTSLKQSPQADPLPADPELERRLRAAEAIAPAPWRTPEVEPPEQLGPYRLREPIGKGGMGVVFLAEHVWLRRLAAVKLLPADRLRDAHAVERFQREMQAVAPLDHPHIVRAYDAGEANGQLYLAMELVNGCDLGRLVKRRGPLAVADACELVRQAALGLQHAHGHGLVHRDLKPSNLMLTPEGTVKLLDLGLARLRPEDVAVEGLTDTHQELLGTADFMAPEQGLDPRGADARSDLYSLGCTLYFLLAGRSPFAEHATRTRKVLAHAHQPAPDIRQSRADVSDALAQLLQRLLAKQPEDRPATAAEVVEALKMFTTGADLMALAAAGAEPPSGSEEGPFKPTGEPSLPEGRARGRWRSRRLLFLTVAIAIVAGMAALVGQIYQYAEFTLHREADALSLTVRRRAARLPEYFQGHTAPVCSVAFSPDGRQALSAGRDQTLRLWDVATGQELRRFEGHAGEVLSVAFSPDGQWCASGGQDHAVLLWDIDTGQEVGRCRGHTDIVKSVAVSPDGRHVLSGSRDRTLRLWDAASGQEVRRFAGHFDRINGVAFSPDGTRALSGSGGFASPRDNSLRCWLVATGEEWYCQKHERDVVCVAVSPDGRLVLSAGDDPLLRLWDAPTGRPVGSLSGHADHVYTAVFSPDSRRVLSGGRDRTVRLWDVATRQELCRFESAGGSVSAVAISPDGRLALAGCQGATVLTEGAALRSQFVVRLWRLPE